MASFVFSDPFSAGHTLYAFASPNGVATFANLNTQLFEAYNVSHWTNYAITMTENSPGVFFGTWPTWFVTGTYYLAIRQQLGGSPASSDGAPFAAGTEVYNGTSPPPPPATLPTPAGIWTVPNSTSPSPACGDITSGASYSQFYLFDFGNVPQIQAGATISGATISAPTVTLTNQAFNGYQCGATITGGVATVDYTVTATVSLSDGSILTPTGTYRVRS